MTLSSRDQPPPNKSVCYRRVEKYNKHTSMAPAAPTYIDAFFDSNTIKHRASQVKDDAILELLNSLINTLRGPSQDPSVPAAQFDLHMCQSGPVSQKKGYRKLAEQIGY